MDTSSPSNSMDEKKMQRRDFWLGVAGCILGNILLAVASFGFVMVMPIITNRAGPSSSGLKISLEMAYTLGSMCLNILPWLLNVGALILVLVKRRPWIALGMVAVYGVVLLLSLIAGIVLAVICFVSLANL